MNHKVHHIAGVVLGEMALLYYHQPVLSWHTPAILVLTSVAALAPDIDKPTSWVATHQPMRFLSETMETIGLPHRGPLHSIPFVVLLYVLLHFVAGLPDMYVWAITLGYASHIFLDMFNSAGVMLLYPWKFNFKFLPSFMAVSSENDSFGQNAIFSILNMVFYILIINMGLSGLSEIHLFHNVASAIQNFLQQKTKFLWEPIQTFVMHIIYFFKKILPI